VWYLKVFLLFSVVIALLLFGLMNKGQVVTIHWFNPSSAGTSVDFILALFVAYALGGITFFFVGAFREFRQRHRTTRLQHRLDEVSRELDSLRTSPLDGPLSDGESDRSVAPDTMKVIASEKEDEYHRVGERG
jgi:uncharacterized integral membrane protein